MDSLWLKKLYSRDPWNNWVELAFGKWAWLVNGLLWNLFHIFYHANLGSVIAYLPATVPLAFVAQRTRSTWPGIVAHLIGGGASRWGSFERWPADRLADGP